MSVTSRAAVGPNFLRHTDLSLAALDGLGLPSRTAIEIVMTVDTYVNGFVLRELQEKTAHQRERRFDDEVRQAWRSYMKEALATGAYPHLARMGADGVDPDAEGTADERFAFGLECLLDGITARLPQLSRHGRPGHD